MAMDPKAARRAKWRLVVLLCALALAGCRGGPRIDPSGDRLFIWPGQPTYPMAPPPLVPDARPLILAPPPVAAPYVGAPQAGMPLTPTPQPNLAGPPAMAPPATSPPGISSPGLTPPTMTPPGATAVPAQILIRTTGPVRAGVGSVVTYRITLSNVSSTLAQNLVVTDEVAPGLEYLNSNPAATPGSNGQEWRLTTLAAKETKVIEANYRVTRPGSLNYCANYSATGNLTGRSCVTTVVPEARFDVQIRGLQSAAVGSQVTFEIDIINRSDTPATGIVITNRFDVGMEHAMSASPIERDIEDLAPGAMKRIAVTFTLSRPGQLCQTMEVVAKSGQQGTAQACITALGPTGPGTTAPPGAISPGSRPSLEPPGTRPSLEPTPTTPPGSGRTAPPSLEPRPQVGAGPTVNPPAATPPAEARPSILVKKTGPTRRKVNETAEFLIEITNTGNVPLGNVRVTDNYETSLEPVAASQNYSVAGGALSWNLDSIAPGAKVKLQVHCRCLQEVARACNRVIVNAEGLTMADEACLEVVGEGTSDVSKSPSVVAPPIKPPRTEPPVAPRPSPPSLAPGKLNLSIADTVEPVKVGEETVYDIVVKNESQTPDTQLVLSATLSQEIGLTGVTGPVGATFPAGAVRFNPVAEIRAGETLTYQLKVKGRQAGTARVKVEVSSQRLARPVTDEETTSVID